MRAYVPGYELRTPAGLDETLALLSHEPGTWKLFAGGTDIMKLLESGKLAHQNYLNIWNLEELHGIDVTDEHVTMGALTTYTEVQEHHVLCDEFPMLVQAASETGGLAIQNRGTLGGNIINASPAADSPPALLAYDAELELVSINGARWIPYHGFHTGYKQMTLRPDELLARIRLGRNRWFTHQYYRKVGTRKAQAISKVCFAGVASKSNGVVEDVRIALGSVAPVPLRCVRTEAALRLRELNDVVIGRAVDELAREVTPIDDIRSTGAYRLRVCLNLLRDFLGKI